jgi:predicted NBD/HSP70 family sugar kinase
VRAGIDIGGTKTEAVALAEDGRVAGRFRLPTGRGPELVLETAVTAMESLAGSVGIGIREFDSVGVGIPGAVDPATGVISHALNLGVTRLELGGLLGRHIGGPVHVENDVNAAAVGAYHLLGDRAGSSMAYLNLGTGLAAGVVVDGELWRGARGAAGEIGHIIVDPSGPLDLDGQPGGLEVVASGSGIARQWGSTEPDAVLTMLDAADAGDPRATDIRRRLVEGVATAVRILVLTIDVELVVVGGGLSRLGPRIMGSVEDVFARWSGASPFLASLELADRVLVLDADAPVAALGAAHLGGS